VIIANIIDPGKRRQRRKFEAGQEGEIEAERERNGCREICEVSFS
jgi:hypothetical protein